MTSIYSRFVSNIARRYFLTGSTTQSDLGPIDRRRARVINPEWSACCSVLPEGFHALPLVVRHAFFLAALLFLQVIFSPFRLVIVSWSMFLFLCRFFASLPIFHFFFIFRFCPFSASLRIFRFFAHFSFLCSILSESKD